MQRDRDSVRELVLLAEQLQHSGNIDAAIECYQQALRKGTDDVDILHKLYSHMGNAYQRKGDVQQAIEFHRYDFTLSRYFTCVPLASQRRLLQTFQRRSTLSARLWKSRWSPVHDRSSCRSTRALLQTTRIGGEVRREGKFVKCFRVTAFQLTDLRVQRSLHDWPLVAKACRECGEISVRE